MNEFEYDVAVIGGGVTGAAVARELSAYRLRVCLLERDEDVCAGTSKANSAIIHGGYDAIPGSLKAKMNVAGNAAMEQLSADLDFEFKRNGSLVLCFDEADMPSLRELYDRGVANGVPGLRIITGDEVREMEPNISGEVCAALHVPTGGIVCPFGMTIALAENACENGVEFRLNTAVTGIDRLEGGYELKLEQRLAAGAAGNMGAAGNREVKYGSLTARYVVNAAGVYADVFHNMVSEEKIHLVARKGEYCLLDKETGNHVSATIFQLPGKYGKGVLVTPTVHGNLLIGPTAVDIEDKENTATTAAGLAEVTAKSAVSVKNIPYRMTITSFSGLRAHEEKDDFILGEVKDAEGFFDAAGIESPGLSSAPAIGKYLAELIAAKAGAEKKDDFKATRTGITRIAALPKEERAKRIRENPAYGTIVCRCEQISEGEILDAIHRPLGARSLDGVKRRVRAGMGRCQAGFCTPKTMEILARELGCSMEDICKNNDGSQILAGSRAGGKQDETA